MAFRPPTAPRKQLAARHLAAGAWVLCDVTSTYFEGRACPLADFGHSQDGKRGQLQIIFGLLCTQQGCPVAGEVFAGNTADPMTVAPQIHKLRQRFALTRLVLVGARGLLTEARIRDELKPVEGLEWITALRTAAVKQLVNTGCLQLSLFDQRYLAHIIESKGRELRTDISVSRSRECISRAGALSPCQ